MKNLRNSIKRILTREFSSSLDWTWSHVQAPSFDVVDWIPRQTSSAALKCQDSINHLFVRMIATLWSTQTKCVYPNTREIFNEENSILHNTKNSNHRRRRCLNWRVTNSINISRSFSSSNKIITHKTSKIPQELSLHMELTFWTNKRRESANLLVLVNLTNVNSIFSKLRWVHLTSNSI